MNKGLSFLLWAASAVLGLAACSAPGPMDAFEPGERGRVVRIIDGDALVLHTGQSVRLIGIEAPAAPSRDRPGAPYHEEAKRILEDMALGREVQLYYAGLTRDRYDRALAHAVADDGLGPRLWLNAEQVRRGGARVRVYPDTASGSEPLLAAEAAARAERAGLWKKAEYQVRPAAELEEAARGFTILHATIDDMTGTDDGYGAVCDLSLQNARLHLQIQTAAAAYCQLAEGTQVRVRGYVRDGRMEVSHTLNLEILP